MFGNNLFNTTSALSTTSRGLSFSKILSGCNKALNLANKAIPVYYQAKPMFNNAKTILNMYSVMKEPEKKKKIKTSNIKKESIVPSKNYYKNDTLTFFL